MENGPETTLSRFVDYLTRGFTPDLATHFAHLPKPDPEFQRHIDFLAAKANEGTLSPTEAQEYEKTAEYMDFIALLRLKASAVACANGT